MSRGEREVCQKGIKPLRSTGFYNRAGEGRERWPFRVEACFEPRVRDGSGQGCPELDSSWVGLEGENGGDGALMVGGVKKRGRISTSSPGSLQNFEGFELGVDLM